MANRRLVVVSERDHGYIDLDGRRVLTIGRAPENDVVVKDDMVSRRHCRIEAEPDGSFRVRDLKSFNGTYLNERRIRDEPLGLWDALRVGRTRMILVERAETPLGQPRAAGRREPESEVAEAAAPEAEAEAARPEDMGATRTLDVADALASKEMRALIEGVVRNEREQLEQEICRRIRDESGPAVLGALSGHKVRARRIGPIDGGGDFYDVFRDDLLPDELLLGVGSVSGVGIAACVAATSARYGLRGACAPSADVDPRALLSSLRDALIRTLHPGSAVSLLLARISAAGRVRLGATGGTGALHYKAASAELVTLRAPGRRDEEAARAEALEVTLKDGDRLLLTSDGAGSLRDGAGEPFGAERLAAAFSERATLPTKELARDLAQLYVSHAGPTLERDVTLLVVGRGDE